MLVSVLIPFQLLSSRKILPRNPRDFSNSGCHAWLNPGPASIKYVASQRYNSFVLVGTTNAHHFRENVAGIVGPRLTPAEMRYLETGEREAGERTPLLMHIWRVLTGRKT